MYKKDNKELTKTQLTITLILILFVSITGSTYAYFAVAANNNSLTGNMATVNLTLNVTKIFPKESTQNTGVMIPQLSTDAALTSALKGGCVDGNTNVACQVYKIDISNNGGTATQVVSGAISFYSDNYLTTAINSTMPNLKWRLIESANATTPTNSTLGTYNINNATGTDQEFVTNRQMVKDSSYTYYMIIWINETNTDQEDKSTNELEKHFYGKVSFNSSNGTGVTAAFQS